MKRLLLVSSAWTALLAASPVSAADMGVYKAPPYAAPAYSWTGFYIGGNVGSGWGTTESAANLGVLGPLLAPGATLSATLSVTSQTFDGFLGGVQGGTTGSLVLSFWASRATSIGRGCKVTPHACCSSIATPTINTLRT